MFLAQDLGLCDGAITTRSILGPATIKNSEPRSSPCDFLPHPKSALWGRPTSGFLVPLFHTPPVPIPFTPSRFDLGPLGLPIRKFRASPPPSLPETRPYLGAPFLRVPAHQHRGVILEQGVGGRDHGGSWRSSPAAAPPGRALFTVTMETPSPSLMAWAGLRTWAGPAGLRFLRLLRGTFFRASLVRSPAKWVTSVRLEAGDQAFALLCRV